jgi:hypothetical protein
MDAMTHNQASNTNEEKTPLITNLTKDNNTELATLVLNNPTSPGTPDLQQQVMLHHAPQPPFLTDNMQQQLNAAKSYSFNNMGNVGVGGGAVGAVGSVVSANVLAGNSVGGSGTGGAVHGIGSNPIMGGNAAQYRNNWVNEMGGSQADTLLPTIFEQTQPLISHSLTGSGRGNKSKQGKKKSSVKSQTKSKSKSKSSKNKTKKKTNKSKSGNKKKGNKKKKKKTTKKSKKKTAKK